MGSSVESEGEAFCLKWNDFHTSVTTSFAEIRQENDLFDVTLICEGHTLQAHKLVLSACSGAFKSLFKVNLKSHKDPVIYLWDIKAADLNLLLDFMYEGEVNVAQENLSSFLALAEKLQVRGLTTNNNLVTNGSQQQGPKRIPSTSSISSSLPSPKRSKPNEIHPTSTGAVNVKEEQNTEQSSVYNAGLNQLHDHHQLSQNPVTNFPYNHFSYENSTQQPPPPPPVTSTNPGAPTGYVTSNIGTPEDFALNPVPQTQTALVDQQKGIHDIFILHCGHVL